MLSRDNGQVFELSAASKTAGPIVDITQGEGDTLLVVGPRGIKSVALAQ
jgi:hypothetical protein